MISKLYRWKPKKFKKMKVYADIGSHNKIYEFIGGPISERYPNLLNIYSKKIIKGLTPVTILIPIKRRVK